MSKKTVEMECCSIQAHKKQLGLDKLKTLATPVAVPISAPANVPITISKEKKK